MKKNSLVPDPLYNVQDRLTLTYNGNEGTWVVVGVRRQPLHHMNPEPFQWWVVFLTPADPIDGLQDDCMLHLKEDAVTELVAGKPLELVVKRAAAPPDGGKMN